MPEITPRQNHVDKSSINFSNVTPETFQMVHLPAIKKK